MTETLYALIADYGVITVLCVTFLSCLAIPVPSSLLMMASGGFAAAGDLSLTYVFSAAFFGAIFGDNSGYWIARTNSTWISGWLDRHPKRALLRQRGESYMLKWGGSSVFFSCWLVAPLGPYVNYISGITRMNWFRFAIWGVAGEIVWVSLYVGLGYSFADNITSLASLMGNLSGMITAAGLSIGLGWWLWKASNKKSTA